MNDVELNVNEIRPKNPSKLLVFIHGFPETGLIGFKHQLLHFSKFEQYHIVAPDLRGFNTSSKCVDYNDCNPLKACDDIAALIRALNYSSAYVSAPKHE